jgi:hypothetical protein
MTSHHRKADAIGIESLESRIVPAHLWWTDDVLQYLAENGEANRLTITNGGRTWKDDGAAISVDPFYFTGGGGVGAAVTLKPEFDVTSFSITLKDQNDSVDFRGYRSPPSWSTLAAAMIRPCAEMETTTFRVDQELT